MWIIFPLDEIFIVVVVGGGFAVIDYFFDFVFCGGHDGHFLFVGCCNVEERDRCC